MWDRLVPVCASPLCQPAAVATRLGLPGTPRSRGSRGAGDRRLSVPGRPCERDRREGSRPDVITAATSVALCGRGTQPLGDNDDGAIDVGARSGTGDSQRTSSICRSSASPSAVYRYTWHERRLGILHREQTFESLSERRRVFKSRLSVIRYGSRRHSGRPAKQFHEKRSDVANTLHLFSSGP